MGDLLQIIDLLFSVVVFFILAHFIMSWLLNFGVLNIHQPTIRQIWEGLNKLLEPIYGPIRRVIPPVAGARLGATCRPDRDPNLEDLDLLKSWCAEAHLTHGTTNLSFETPRLGAKSSERGFYEGGHRPV